MSLIHITLSSFFIFIFNFRDTYAAPTKHLCRPEQRDVLLEFKNEFEIRKSHVSCSFVNKTVNPHPKTKSWTYNRDCCDWDGITCNAKSREVIELDLSCSCLHGRFQFNSSLFRLKNLRFLNSLSLSYNSLSGQVLSSIGNFSHLTILDLSNNNFVGEIPSSVGNLSHLTFLDFSNNNFVGEIPSSIGNLSHLTFLYLSNNYFVGRIPYSIGRLSLLTSLDLSLNHFVGEIPSSIANLSNLASVSFFENKFVGEIPSFFGSLNQLTDISFSSNKMSGNLPITLLNLTKLSSLDISYNQFTGTLPTNINSLSSLNYFDGRVNSFVGTIPSSLFTIPSLVFLELSNNLFNGTFELRNISSSSQLTLLFISNNNFRGPFPRSISKLVNLQILQISHFNTQGPVDFSIFSHLKFLGQLIISYLNTTTTIDLNEILSLHLKSIYELDLSGNHVSTTNKSSVAIHPLLSLSELYLSNCSITELPELLTNIGSLSHLDISNNKIKGDVPGWLWTRLWYVNLSNNSFTGFERPIKPGKSAVLKPSITYLFASDNNFTGKIPSFICTLHSLNTLDLSNNNFNGWIPRCLVNIKSSLSHLILHQNLLSGDLPENIYENLRSLDIGHNQLVGKLPRSLIRSSTLEVLNVESNRINDTFPFWLSSIKKLQILVLRSNAFHGPIRQSRFAMLRIMDISHNHFSGTLPSDFFVNWNAISSLGKEKKLHLDDEKYMGSVYYHDSVVLMNKDTEMKLVRILKIFTAVDFSGNNLEGEIPRSIGLLKALIVLNLSNNAFSGNIPSSMANLSELESLDVSQNKLSGEIPQEMGSLSYLSYMNFSHNQLVGLVPTGTQFRRQSCSSFEDNPGLFGPSLDEICRDIHISTPQQYEPEKEDEEVLSWVAAAVGFVPGIVFGLTIGYILVSYKREWFMNIFGRNKRRRISTTTHG